MKDDSHSSPGPRLRQRFATWLRPVVLYRAAGTTVTTAFVESAGRRYPLAELDMLRRVELRPRWFELWAHFQGRTVRLFRSDNAQEFGKVCRALVRARELAGLA
jgi:hypothetical protein